MRLKGSKQRSAHGHGSGMQKGKLELKFLGVFPESTSLPLYVGCLHIYLFGGRFTTRATSYSILSCLPCISR